MRTLREYIDLMSESLDDIEVGDKVEYDSGEGLDRWTVMMIDDNLYYLENAQGATTSAYGDDIYPVSEELEDLQEEEQEVEEAATSDAIKRIDDLYNDK